MKMFVALAVLGLAACGGPQDPLQGDWTFEIGNNAAGQRLDDGSGALHIFEDGNGYSNATETVPPTSQMFGAVTWSRNGTSVRLNFCSPSQVPIATPHTFAIATITADGTLEGIFHDELGSWDGARFSAHRLAATAPQRN